MRLILALLAALALPTAALPQALPSPRVQTRPANDNSTNAASTAYVDQSAQILLNAVSSRLSRTSNLSDLASPSAARGNLGLGSAATANIGTGAGSVAAGDDGRIVSALQPTTDLSGNPVTASAGAGSGTLAKALGDQAAAIAGKVTAAGGPGDAVTVLGRSLAARARDTLNPRDYGAVGDGVARTAGATLGISTRAGLAGYTANGVQPYAWINAYPYGTLFSLPVSAAATSGATTLSFGVTRLQGLSIVGSASAAGQNIIGMQAYGLTNGTVAQATGIPTGATVTSIFGGSIALSANLTAPITNGTPIAFLQPSPAKPASVSAAAASGATALTITSAPGLDSRLVGCAITGSNLAAGTTIAALSGTALTLSAATTGAVSNGATLSVQCSYSLNLQDVAGVYPGMSVSGAGIAAGTQVDWVNSSTLEIGLSKPTTAIVAGGASLTFAQPWLANVTVGMQVTGEVVAAGTTVSAVNVGAGTVTLSTGLTAAATSVTTTFAASPAYRGTAVTFYAPYTDAQAAALQMDGLGMQAAVRAAEAAGGGTVRVPSGTYLLDQTIIFPVGDGPGSGVGLEGGGIAGTNLSVVADLGPGRSALSCGDPTATADNLRGMYAGGGKLCFGEWRDFSLRMANATTALGRRPQVSGVSVAMDGVKQGPRRNMRRVNIERFVNGILFQGDWTSWDYVIAANNFVGFRHDEPMTNLFGDYSFHQVFFGGNAFAGISISPRTGLIGTKITKSWIADQPYDIWFEPGLTSAPSALQQAQFSDVNFEGSGCGWIKDGNIVDSAGGGNDRRGVESLSIDSSYVASADNSYTLPSGCPWRAYVDLSTAQGLAIDNIPYNAFPWHFGGVGIVRLHSAKNFANNRGGVRLSGANLAGIVDSYSAAGVCQEIVTGGGGTGSSFATSGSWKLVELEMGYGNRVRVMPFQDTGATTLPRGSLLETIVSSGRIAVQRSGQAAAGTAPVAGVAASDYPSCAMSGKLIPVYTGGLEVPVRVSAAQPVGTLLKLDTATVGATAAATNLSDGRVVGIVTDNNSGSTSQVWMQRLTGGN